MVTQQALSFNTFQHLRPIVSNIQKQSWQYNVASFSLDGTKHFDTIEARIKERMASE